MKAEITKIQRFSTHDGGGVRTTVFFRGCPLRCPWCHNPETWGDACAFYYNAEKCIGCKMCENACKSGVHIFDGGHTVERTECASCFACTEVCPTGALEASYKTADTSEILETVLRDREFFGKEGGITVSGGEPMAQPEAAIELLTISKKAGIGTAIETSGVWNHKFTESLCRVCDLFLWDIKDGKVDRLKKNTGADLDKILKNLYTVDSLGGKTELRCIMIKRVNMDFESFSGIAEIYKNLKNCRGIKLLPFHPYASSKSSRLGKEYTYGKDKIPSKADIASAKKFFRDCGVRIVE